MLYHPFPNSDSPQKICSKCGVTLDGGGQETSAKRFVPPEQCMYCAKEKKIFYPPPESTK
ncbi:MAG: hypothetical protein PHH83_03445 [Patescibacteria group bacterium]|nr:hypothetical protein [Patescibacteria group bacterium]